MAVLDADFGTDLTPSEGGDTLWSLPIAAPASEPLDWASLLEEAEARIEVERGRARVSELRREELRQSERDPRALANSLTRRLDTCRFKLKATAPKTASRAVKTLERRVESQNAEISDLRITSRRSHEHHEQVEAHHQDEINWLKQDIDRARSRIARMHRKGERVAESLRKQFDRRLAAAQCLVEACGDLREDRRQPTVAEAIAVHRAIPTRRLAFVLCLLALGQTVMAQTQPQAEHALPLVRSASHPVQEGFVRIINRSNRRGTVSIHAIDDSGRRVGPLSLSLNAKETVHFNSEDLERGNPSKGLPPPGAGTGHGDWRLELDTELDIEALGYIRTSGGFDCDGDEDFFMAPSHITATIHNDGRPAESAPVQLYENDGDGDFALSTESFIRGKIPESVAGRKVLTGDFNGDGRPDIFVADHGADSHPFPSAHPLLLLSSVNGLRSEAGLEHVVGFHHGAASGDIDQDGDLDIFLTDTRQPLFLENDGGGKFVRDLNAVPAELKRKRRVHDGEHRRGRRWRSRPAGCRPRV